MAPLTAAHVSSKTSLLTRRGSRIFCRGGGQRRPCTADAFGARADGGSRVDKHQIKVHSVHRIFRAIFFYFFFLLVKKFVEKKIGGREQGGSRPPPPPPPSGSAPANCASPVAISHKPTLPTVRPHKPT